MTKEEKAAYKREYYQKHKERILAQKREYRQTHKDQIREYNRNYEKANKGKQAVWGKKYIEKNKEKIRQYRKQYSVAHKEFTSKQNKEYREKNKAKITERMKKYNKTDVGKAINKKCYQKRRALKMGSGYKAFDTVEILERDDYICQSCGRKTRPEFNNRYHPLYPNVDHIVPLSDGGSHTKENTQCLCRQCNVTKGNTGVGDQLRMFG